MLKEELEAIIASDNVWSGRSTLVLAIGILGEYVVLPFFDKTKGIYLPEEKVAIPRWAERGSARRCWFLEQARSNPRPGQCPGLHRGVNPARI